MVRLGQLATVSVIVTNVGGHSGNCTLFLEVDGQVVKSQNVTLAARASQNVTFSISSNVAGTRVIKIGENTCNLTVHVAAPEMPGKASECGAM